MPTREDTLVLVQHRLQVEACMRYFATKADAEAIGVG